MRVVLVDPSLYTAPYDAALSRGLVAANVQPMWATRPVRRGDRAELPAERTDTFFYRHTDEADWLPASLRPFAKGCAHFVGLATLVWKIRRNKPNVVHVQWVVVPLLDILAMALIRRWCPLVLTVHDTVPYNGQKMPSLQHLGHTLPARLAHHIIVHTQSGRETMRRYGIAGERISVIPHGPLRLSVPSAACVTRDSRWTMVLFGEIKPYKGLDMLVEAVAALPEPVRARLRIVVAGRPRMDLAPLIARMTALGIAGQFVMTPRRLTENEMATLFAEADGFLFPYRQVDASGVYYLVKSLGKWLIASRLGVFAEEIGEAQGALVPSGDVAALAKALEYAVEKRPRGNARPDENSWVTIGRTTRALYERLSLGFR